MAVLHELICKGCGKEFPEQLVEVGEYGTCDDCGGERTWRPSGFHTDVFGSPQYSDAGGRFFSSTREKEAFMKIPRKVGPNATVSYEPVGDPVGGARPELKLKDSTFSFAGQGSRTSGGERAQTREQVRRFKQGV